MNDPADAIHETRTLMRWARRYRLSRTLPAIVGLLVCSALMAGLLLLWGATGRAYRAGDTVVLVLCILVLIPANGLLVWLSVPRWGGRWLGELGWKYYDKRDGWSAAHSGPVSNTAQRRLGVVIVTVFASCVLLHVGLGFMGYVSSEQMQPVSALYVVPFLTVLALLLRQYIQLLFPFLYGLHALLLVAGLPNPVDALFGEDWRLLGPMVLYGLITGVVGHAYNRYARARMMEYARRG